MSTDTNQAAAPPHRRRRGNRFWYGAAAISFSVKVAIVVLLVLGLRAAADLGKEADKPAPAAKTTR